MSHVQACNIIIFGTLNSQCMEHLIEHNCVNYIYEKGNNDIV